MPYPLLEVHDHISKCYLVSSLFPASHPHSPHLLSSPLLQPSLLISVNGKIQLTGTSQTVNTLNSLSHSCIQPYKCTTIFKFPPFSLQIVLAPFCIFLYFFNYFDVLIRLDYFLINPIEQDWLTLKIIFQYYNIVLSLTHRHSLVQLTQIQYINVNFSRETWINSLNNKDRKTFIQTSDDFCFLAFSFHYLPFLYTPSALHIPQPTVSYPCLALQILRASLTEFIST